ncbi:MAG: dihydrolipoamide acetyltransferase family protein [Anaerolineales bacterium]|jgi:pyruvate dehydrogenase E2 component (dihydrolipoamide acetyltransferase)
MADVVEMPKLGFDMAEGTLVRWVISEGDEIAKGEVLAEIETDKATVEVESSFTGVVRKHLIPEGEIVPVGTPIAVIGESGEEIDLDALIGAAEPAGEAKGKAEQAAAADREEQPTEMAQAQPAQPASTSGEEFPGGIKASPVARRMAEDNGLDLKAINGSGPGGRIVKKDIEAYLEKPPVVKPEEAAKETEEAPAGVMMPAPVFSPVGPAPEDQRIPLNRLRAAIGRRMTEAKQQLPHFYVTHEYDMGKVMASRQEANTLLEGTGEKLSVNDFIVKAVALGLRAFPNLNASLEGNEIVQHGQVNIGIAVAVEGGLLTVVCRDADRKSLRQISSEVRAMAGRARSGKVKPDDIEGSTFSISNLGMFDVEEFIAIINPPEAAILAVGSVVKVPVVKNDEIVIGQRMKATISVDHRVSDGAEAAQFLQMLKDYLEEPMRLML